MPVPAARQTEVLSRDAHPLEVLWRDEHALDQPAVLLLEAVALRQRQPRLGGPVGELVAQSLQLAQVQHSRRRGDGADAVRNLGVAESLAEEAGELRLEAGDLLAQLESRPALVDGSAQPADPIFSEQSRHPEKCSQLSPRVEATSHRASSTAICGTPLT